MSRNNVLSPLRFWIQKYQGLNSKPSMKKLKKAGQKTFLQQNMVAVDLSSRMSAYVARLFLKLLQIVFVKKVMYQFILLHRPRLGVLLQFRSRRSVIFLRQDAQSMPEPTGFRQHMARSEALSRALLPKALQESRLFRQQILICCSKEIAQTKIKIANRLLGSLLFEALAALQ